MSTWADSLVVPGGELARRRIDDRPPLASVLARRPGSLSWGRQAKMKHLPPFLFLACALLLGGCATPLNVAKDSRRFAHALGISTNDVLFLNYCFFGKSPKAPKPKFKRVDGVVVTTPSQVNLMDEKVRTNGEPRPTSLEYSQMLSVAHISQGLGCQIHIESADYVIVVSLTKGPFWDRHSSKILFDFIASKGVRVVEAMRWYDFIGTGGMAPIPLGF